MSSSSLGSGELADSRCLPFAGRLFRGQLRGKGMRYLLGSMMLVASAGAVAADAPLIGTVHNTKDNGWLTYECDPVEDERLTCTMTQVMIRKKLNTSELEAKYQEAIKGIEAETKGKNFAETCKLAEGVVDVMRGGPGTGLPPEAKQSIQKFNAMQRRDMEQQFSAVLEACKTKNLDGVRRFIRLGLEQDARTCTVSTNRFEQTFRPVTDLDGKLTSWIVADTTPQGDCGFVQMSRFIPDDKPLGGKIFLWKYIGKRATSNPEGQTLLGISCKGWDESETVYDWQEKPIPLQCDYIEHSIF